MNIPEEITVYEACGFTQRLRGLLWRAELSPDEALFIPNCNHVHSIGMTYALDVVFLSAMDKVVKTALLKPYRHVYCMRACSVLELKCGTAKRLNIGSGVELSITHKLNIGRRHSV